MGFFLNLSLPILFSLVPCIFQLFPHQILFFHTHSWKLEKISKAICLKGFQRKLIEYLCPDETYIYYIEINHKSCYLDKWKKAYSRKLLAFKVFVSAVINVKTGKKLHPEFNNVRNISFLLFSCLSSFCLYQKWLETWHYISSLGAFLPNCISDKMSSINSFVVKQKRSSFSSGHARMLFIVRKAIAEDSKNKSETIKFAVINEAIPVTSSFVFSFQHFFGSLGPFALWFAVKLMTLFTAYSSKVFPANYKTWKQIKRPLELV